jgi:phosphate transport system substrate-binding protein
MLPKLKQVFTLGGALLLITGTVLLAGKNDLTISGSTTVLPIAQRAAETYMDMNEEANISVRGGGSGVGIAAIIDGRADIADASRPIKSKELALARSKGRNPVAHVVANDGLAIVVHPNNPLNGIDIPTLKKIYTGAISSWKDLGGSPVAIVVVSRDVSSGTFEVFNKLVLGGAKVQGGALMVASNKAAATSVAKTPGAIGYIGIGYLSAQVKAVPVGGILPSVETVQNGSYTLARELYMYTNGKPKGVAKGFIDFILSADGQKIVKEVGFVPIR